VELPTYTNIWKIEKRLYKLYDFRLPMPLPVGQIAAFLAIAVPYTLILTMVGMPFSHTWVWLYVLPPAVLAWLVTRPVLEGKRLPELVLSQLRYLSEPRTWCRMAPLTEADHVVVVARVWRSDRVLAEAASSSAFEARLAPEPTAEEAAPRSLAEEPEVAEQPESAQQPGLADRPLPLAASDSAEEARPSGQSRPEPWPQPKRSTAAAPDVDDATGEPRPSERDERISEAPIRAHDRERARVRSRSARPGRDGPPPGSGAESRPPNVRVAAAESQARPLSAAERAPRTSPAEPGTSSRPQPPVVAAPGGHRSGKPDPLQRDQARTRLALAGPSRILVLGCAVGAGQTTTTLLTGQLLSALRDEAVAVVDFSTGAGSLASKARMIPALLPRARAGGPAAGHDTPGTGERGLHVVTNGDTDPETLITSVVARYPLTLADPDAPSVPRALRVTDQLILVAPASADAAPSLAMTLEWLEVNDHARLAASAVTVMNGVSDASREHVDQAAAVVSGRCRAVVRVPWDDCLAGRSSEGLSAAAVRAYTALAGVVVAALADAANRSAVR
jgi:TcpE family